MTIGPITGAARLSGVLGWPVAHSRSPRLHNFWLGRHGIDGAYVPLPVRPDDLRAALSGLAACGFAGANVTIPHKEAVFAACTSVDDSARLAGAVNTLMFRNGGLHGYNTDGAGFLANLSAHGISLQGPALLLGAGGAARAIAAALLASGVRVTVANRSILRAQALAASLPGIAVGAWHSRAEALADHALLVNTTSLGMMGQPQLDLDLSHAHAGLAVADIVYVPLRTRLLEAAAARGLRTVEGLGMLLHQAVPGFAAWFGVTPVVDDAVRTLVSAGIPLTS
jgi:shikimate dehydrogenase